MVRHKVPRHRNGRDDEHGINNLQRALRQRRCSCNACEAADERHLPTILSWVVARFGSAVSLLDFMQLGSSLALRSFCRLGSAMSMYGLSRLGSSVSMLDFASLGSACALRSSISSRGGSSGHSFGRAVM